MSAAVSRFSNRHVRSGPTTGQNCSSGMMFSDQRLPFRQPALFHFVGGCLNDVFDGRSNALRIGRLAGCRPNQLVAAQIVNKGFNLDLRVVAPWDDRKSVAPAVRIVVPERSVCGAGPDDLGLADLLVDVDQPQRHDTGRYGAFEPALRLLGVSEFLARNQAVGSISPYASLGELT